MATFLFIRKKEKTEKKKTASHIQTEKYTTSTFPLSDLFHQSVRERKTRSERNNGNLFFSLGFIY